MQNKGLTIRTIDLLLELNRHDFSSLDDLQQALNIPKPTLHRLLADLIDLQLVTKHPDTHIYSVTSRCAQLSHGVTPQLLFIEKAAEIAQQLTTKTEWPLAVATAKQGEMLIRFSSRPNARYSFIKSTVGKSLPLIGSALGEIWLAQRHEREQIALLKQQPSALLQRRLKQLKLREPLAYLAQVKQQGYALRYGASGESSHLAVPVRHGNRLMGSIGISVFTTVVGKQIIPLYLKVLLVGVQDIQDSLKGNEH